MRMLAVVALVLAGSAPQDSSDPVAAIIDGYFDSRWTAGKITPAKPADDYEFFRRLSLDVLGRLPKPDEVRSYAADRSPGKREAAVDRMLALADEKTRIIPGHGELTDKAGLAAYREMLATTSGRVRELVKAGKTLEEALAAKPNADYDAKLAWDFITPERYLTILYRDAGGSLPVK